MSKIQVPVNWSPRAYQFPLWSYLENGGNRAVAIWHRRAGKDLTAVNWTARSIITRPGLYWHLLPTYNQGRKIVWDGMTKDGRGFMSHFPEPLICGVNNTDMKLEFRNGALWQVVGTDNVDRLVGANPVGCVFSEYSLQDPRAWEYIRPILAENGGWAIFIYTPRGRNHGYDLYRMAKQNPKWHAELLSVDITKAISKSVIDEERKSGMPEEMIQQEFYCSFDAPLTGSYYGEQMTRALEEKRITACPHDPHLEVHTGWDIGVGDSTAIWFAQVYGMEVRIIDYHEASGEGLPYYARVLKEKQESLGYNYGDHYAPHDIEAREFSSGETRKDVARKLGIRFEVIPRLSVETGIEQVRALLPCVIFDETRCDRGIEAMRQYRKEFDDKKKCYSDRPYHDWTSHGADAFRTLAMGLKRRRRMKFHNIRPVADGDYNELAL